MKLYVESVFNATPEEVWAAFHSEAFAKALAEESGMQTTVLEDVIDDQSIAKLVAKRMQAVLEDHVVPATVAVDQGHPAAALHTQDGF